MPRKPNTTHYRLSELLPEYLSRRGHRLRPATIDMLKRSWAKLIDVLGDVRADSLDADDAERFQAALLNEGYAPTTCNMWCGSVSPVWTWARAKGLLDDQPFEGLGKLKVARREVRTYDSDQILDILLACPDDLWRARVLCGLASLRIGEVLNLTREDVDFERQIITIQPKAEGPLTWRWDVKDIERRTVPLPEDLANLLVCRIIPDLPVEQPYLTLREDRWLHLLWLRSRGKLTDRMRGTPDTAYARQLRQILDRADKKGTFHDGRRTCLTRWLESGELAPAQVQRLAGHADIETTLRYYYRCDTSRAVETARHIEVWNSRNPMQAR